MQPLVLDNSSSRKSHFIQRPGNKFLAWAWSSESSLKAWGALRGSTVCSKVETETIGTGAADATGEVGTGSTTYTNTLSSMANQTASLSYAILTNMQWFSYIQIVFSMAWYKHLRTVVHFPFSLTSRISLEAFICGLVAVYLWLTNVSLKKFE